MTEEENGFILKTSHYSYDGSGNIREVYTKAKNGDKCLLSTGEDVIIERVEVENLTEAETTYNFEVADFYTYYGTGKDVLVHNTCRLDPQDIRYTQDSVSKYFSGLYKSESVDDLIDALKTGSITPDDLPPER